MKENIGYCGIDCERCDVYLATKNGDEELRKKTAELWSKLNGTAILPEYLYCMGCRTAGVKTYYCSDMCKIRKCAAEKRHETCAECAALHGCETVKPILEHDENAKKNLQSALRIACIGDSLTEGDYGIAGKRGIPNVHAENYPFFLSELTGAETANFGKCGWHSSTMLRLYEEGGIDAAAYDVILVMLGTNGGQSLTEDTADNRAYRTLIEKLRADAPRARIFLLTPPHVTENPAYSNCGYIGNVRPAVAFTRLVAKEYGLDVIETAEIPEFCAENEHIYQKNDGLHFVEAGYRVLAAFIAEKLRSFGVLL